VERVGTLEELVAVSDAVSLHSHLPEGNSCMFDAKMLAKFKPGSYLINTARGPLIDDIALIDALKNGALAGAGIDVHPKEFEPGFFENLDKDPLIRYATQHDNLILTPHIAGCTYDAWQMTEQHVIRMMIEAFDGKR
jgi:phosphoglycerate dehydrogenase-like enzyme